MKFSRSYARWPGAINNNIIRNLVNVLRVKVTAVPWDYDFTEDSFDGLFPSNGPGDPTKCQATVEHIRAVMRRPTGSAATS